MEQLQCDYRDCDQHFKSETKLAQHKHDHVKKRNLSIHLPTKLQQNSAHLNPTSPTSSQYTSFSSQYSSSLCTGNSSLHTANSSLCTGSCQIHQAINYSNQIDQNVESNDAQSSKLLTPKLLLTPKSSTLSLGGFIVDELAKNQSPIPYKDLFSNPFAETFKQATQNPPINNPFNNYDVDHGKNNRDDNTESLNTPSIDLKSFDQRKLANCSKLDLIISADQFSTFDNLTSPSCGWKNENPADKECNSRSIETDPVQLGDCSEENKMNDEAVDDVPQNLSLDTSTSKDSTNSTSNASATSVKLHKHILPKSDMTSSKPDQEPPISYVLKLKKPDGSFVPISLHSTTNPTSSNHQPSINSLQTSSLSVNNLVNNHHSYIYSKQTPITNTAVAQQPINEPFSLSSFPHFDVSHLQMNQTKAKSAKKRNLSTGRKKKHLLIEEEEMPEKIETTTLKSIRNVLMETSSKPSQKIDLHLDKELNQKVNKKLGHQTDQQQVYPSFGNNQTAKTDPIIKLEAASISSQYSSSSQCSTNSSLYYQSNNGKDSSFNDNSNQSGVNNSTNSTNDLKTARSAKSKLGRRGKNKPKEDPTEKKARSLERNRNAAQRCRKKRKDWMGALENKADELEKQNSELRVTYDNLRQEVMLLKSRILSNNKGETGHLNSLSNHHALSINHPHVLSSSTNNHISLPINDVLPGGHHSLDNNHHNFVDGNHNVLSVNSCTSLEDLHHDSLTTRGLLSDSNNNHQTDAFNSGINTAYNGQTANQPQITQSANTFEALLAAATAK